MADRQWLLDWWQKAWTEGLYHVGWGKALEGLTAQQAAWKPAPQRHSIWQVLHHILFWREYALRAMAGDKPDKAEINRRNWEEPAEVSDDAWQTARRRFADSHQQVLEAIGTVGEKELERLAPYIAHDSYHAGQIMTLRGLQDLPPLD
jgi:uncharacterized damage-inducible protein DinB